MNAVVVQVGSSIGHFLAKVGIYQGVDDYSTFFINLIPISALFRVPFGLKFAF